MARGRHRGLGDTGASGDRGTSGDAGSPGALGVMGLGDTGALGDTGLGDTGTSGDRGAWGTQGRQGTQGCRGTQGRREALGLCRLLWPKRSPLPGRTTDRWKQGLGVEGGVRRPPPPGHRWAPSQHASTSEQNNPEDPLRPLASRGGAQSTVSGIRMLVGRGGAEGPPATGRQGQNPHNEGGHFKYLPA